MPDTQPTDEQIERAAALAGWHYARADVIRRVSSRLNAEGRTARSILAHARTIAAAEAREVEKDATIARMREALEQIEYRSTNHGGWFDQPGQQFAEYCKLGEIARATLAALGEQP